MSQINDALKRAKAAQQDNPPPAHGPQLLPPDPAQQTTRGIGLAIPFVFVLVALLGLLFLWEIRQKKIAENPSPKPETIASASAVPQPLVQPVPTETPKPVATPAPAEVRAEPVPPAPPPAPVVTPTAPATPVVSAASPAPALKLQAILFNPRSSSAMINGRMVIKGDKVNDYRVASIGQSVVTLVNSRQTNVLTLNR